MDIDDKTVEITEKIIKALDYAQTHKLNIGNKDDVKKILDEIDPQHTSDIEVEEFMNLLQDADTFMDMSSRKMNKKSELPN